MKIIASEKKLMTTLCTFEKEDISSFGMNYDRPKRKSD